MRVVDLGVTHVYTRSKFARPRYWITIYSGGDVVCSLSAANARHRDEKIAEWRGVGDEARYTWVIPTDDITALSDN